MAKRFILTGMGIASLGVTIPVVADMPRMLIWNASASVPVGLYRIEGGGRYVLGDLIVVMPRDDLARFMASRGYLPSGVPLIKPIAALPGQEVCRHGVMIYIDGVVVAEALERDRQGRDLPRWAGCRRIAEGEFFLLNAGIRDSLTVI